MPMCSLHMRHAHAALLEVVPQAVAPNTAIQIYGNPTGSMNSDWCAHNI